MFRGSTAISEMIKKKTIYSYKSSTTFTILSRKSCFTQTTISFARKTRFTGFLIIARVIGARALRWYKEV